MIDFVKYNNSIVDILLDNLNPDDEEVEIIKCVLNILYFMLEVGQWDSDNLEG